MTVRAIDIYSGERLLFRTLLNDGHDLNLRVWNDPRWGPMVFIGDSDQPVALTAASNLHIVPVTLLREVKP